MADADESSWKGWLMILQGHCWKVAVTAEFGVIEADDWSTSWIWRLVKTFRLKFGPYFGAEFWSWLVFWTCIMTYKQFLGWKHLTPGSIVPLAMFLDHLFIVIITTLPKPMSQGAKRRERKILVFLPVHLECSSTTRKNYSLILSLFFLCRNVTHFCDIFKVWNLHKNNEVPALWWRDPQPKQTSSSFRFCLS